jgi:predicted PurR-regulated permease PerM
VTYAVQHANEWIDALHRTVADFETRYNVELLSDANIARIGNTVSTAIPQILGATFNGLTAIFFMYFILYFMFVGGRQMEKLLFDYIPLQDKNVERLEKEIHLMVVSNAVGIPVVAIAQGWLVRHWPIYPSPFFSWPTDRSGRELQWPSLDLGSSEQSTMCCASPCSERSAMYIH